MKRVLLITTFILIVLLTLFPRCIELLANNYLFGFDQGREMLAAKGIVVDHKFILIGTELGAGSAGISGLFHGPIYYYLLTVPFLLFKGDPYGAVVLMFVLSVATVIFSFFLGKKLFSLKGGLLLSFLVAVSPPLIAQARFIWSPNPPSFFILLAFYFLYLFIVKQKYYYLLFAAFFSAFVYNFEFALAVPMCLTVFVFAISFLKNKVKLLSGIISGFLLGFLPMLFFEIRHHFLGLHGVITYIFHHKASSSHIKDSSLTLLSGHWQTFLGNISDAFPGHGILPGWLLGLVLLIGTVFFLRKEKNDYLKKFIFYLLLLFPVNFFVFSFLRNTVYNYYLTDLTFVYLILLTYIIWSAFYQKKIVFQILGGGYIIVLLFMASFSSVSTSFHDYPDFGGTAKIKGLEQAMDYIYTDTKDRHFGLLIFAPPVYTYQYDYMVWWYGQRKYQYKPYTDKKGIVYLLIEPDPYKPWSYNGWLETVIKTGTVMITTTLPSGFIVQTRDFNQ